MKLLAIDTATEACSAAILIDSVITQKFEVAPRKHAELILVMIDQLLAESGLLLEQLDGIAFGCGPGAFTGIRIATGITQGLAYATGLPVVPISNLAALAQSVDKKERVILSAIDARMKEIYWCIYTRNADEDITPVMDETVSSPDQITVQKVEENALFGIGSGWNSYSEIITKTIDQSISGIDAQALPQAKHILELAIPVFKAGNYIDAEKIRPVYLRNNVTG
jgi:tRNA threonylcarbamoyladenosine biosynthesis protein TsaB